MEQVAGSGKPPAIVAKMVEGRLGKFYAESTLLGQAHMIEEGNPKVRMSSRSVSSCCCSQQRFVCAACAFCELRCQVFAVVWSNGTGPVRHLHEAHAM